MDKKNRKVEPTSTANSFLLWEGCPLAIIKAEKLFGGAGGRTYYRIWEDSGTSWVLCQNTNITENKTFISLTTAFSSPWFPIIRSVSPDFSSYIISDLGDTTLLSIRTSNREKSLEYYKNVLIWLGRFQNKNKVFPEIVEPLDFTHLYPQALTRDLWHFKCYFIEPLLGGNYKEQLLADSFDSLLAYGNSWKNTTLTLRDFQGRNLMIRNGKHYIIDYQSAMMGFPLYDVVSLLWQAKAKLSHAEKLCLLEHYIAHQEILSPDEARNQYEYCAVLRTLQVLGAYGLRGLIENKPHFVESIPFALANLSDTMHFELWNTTPFLRDLCQKLIKQWKLNTKQ